MPVIALSSREKQSTAIDGATFFWMPLNGRTKAACLDLLAAGSNFAACQLAVSTSLVGWDGVVDKAGNAVPFPGDGERATDLLNGTTVGSIGTEIFRASLVTESDRGN